MSALQPAQPQYGRSQSIAVGTSSTSITLPSQGNAGGSMQVQLFNSGTNAVFVRIGQGTVNASLTSPNADFPIGPNAAVIITKSIDDNVVAAISSAAGNTLWVTPVTGW